MRDYKVRDYKQDCGRTNRIQYVKAHHGGKSTMGTPYSKGDPIVHMSSSRATGEVLVFTRWDLYNLLKFASGKSGHFSKCP